MADDVIHLEGEPARALVSLLQQTLTTGANAMSEALTQTLEAVRANSDVTASLRQAFDAFRTQQQGRLDEALARVETEIAGRVQAEGDRDALLAGLADIRTAVQADTAQESELLSAVTANTPAAPSAPTPEPAPAPAPAEPPVAVEPVPATETPVDAAPVVTPVEAAPATETPVTETPVVAPVETAPVGEAPVETAPAVVPPADGGEPAPAPAV